MAKVKKILTELVEVSIEDLRDLTSEATVDEDAPRRDLDRLEAFDGTLERHENSPPDQRVTMLKGDLLWLVDAGRGELPPSVDATHVRIPTAELTVLLDSFALRSNASAAERGHHRALSRCLDLRPSQTLQRLDCLVRHDQIGWAKMQAAKAKQRAEGGGRRAAKAEGGKPAASPAAASPADVKGRREGEKAGGGEKPK